MSYDESEGLVINDRDAAPYTTPYEDAPERSVCCPALTPGRKWFRYSILLGCCLLTFGSYFSYDIPAALNCQLEALYDVGNLGYELLYSVYSVPNMVLPFCGGWLVDRVFGIRIGGMVFCGLVTVGQIVFAASTSFAGELESFHSGYYLALIGRIIFGLGGECLSVVQSTYCAKWFAGKELALAFGITLSFSRIGSALNFIIVPSIGDENPWIATWLGAILCGVSVMACLLLAVMDKRGEQTSKDKKDVKADEKISLSDVLHFPLTIWILYFICITFYVSIFTFITIATTFFQYKYSIPAKRAGFFTAIPYTLSAFLSPFGGFLVDKVGRSLTWVLGASILVTGAHTLLLLGEDSWAWAPWVAMTVIGVAYSICAASLWPCVPLIVQQHQLGTAYGLMTSLQNSGLALAPFVVGLLNSAGGSSDACADSSSNQMSGGDKDAFNKAMLFFVACAGTAALLSLLMIFVDWYQKGFLNAPAEVVRAALQAAEDKQKEDLVAEIDEEEEVVVKPDARRLMAPRSHMHVRNAYLMRVGILPSSISVQTDSRRSMQRGTPSATPAPV